MNALRSNPVPWLAGGSLAVGGALFYRFGPALGLSSLAPLGALAAGAGLVWISLGIRRLASRKQPLQNTTDK